MSQIKGGQQKSLTTQPNIQRNQISTGVNDAAPPSYFTVTMRQGGWAIVSGDDAIHPIIGYSQQGTIDPENLPPAFIEWMEQVNEQIKVASQESETVTSIASAWENTDINSYDIVANIGVAPLVKTTWGPGTYYNSQCPVDYNGFDDHALVGCCAVAISQVMKYHNWPDTGSGSNSYYHSTYGTLSANFGATTYDWSSMPSTGYLTSHNSAVATLLSDVGISVNMDYGAYSSGCNADYITKSLSPNFKYKSATLERKSSYTDAAWKEKMIADLNANRPIIYIGTGTGGHAFIADGFSGTDYFHFNWGWNGAADGYFQLTNLNPATSNFTNKQGAIFGIEPEIGSATLIAPSGNVANTAPSFTWQADSIVDWHYLYVKDSNDQKIGAWYRTSDACSTNDCSVTPATELASGDGLWSILTYNNTYGFGSWSSLMNFHLPDNTAPGPATLLSPSGEITDTTPTYTWQPENNADFYYLYVTDSTGVIIGTWYRASDVCSTQTCAVTSATKLAGGDKEWRVFTYSYTYGYGAWSSPMQFHLPAGAPGPATLISPSGNITDSTPTYTWQPDSNVDWYYLYVKDSTGLKIGSWYPASDVCSTYRCAVTSSTRLAKGDGTWWVFTYNNTYGNGSWSSSMGFRL